MTPYNYVQNNPIIRVDPTGALDTLPDGRNIWELDNREMELFSDPSTRSQVTGCECDIQLSVPERLYMLGKMLTFAMPSARVLKGAQVVDDAARVADDVVVGFNMEKAAWAQTTFSNTFSKTGQQVLSNASGGQSIRTIDDAVNALQSGNLSVSDVPIDVINRGGNTLILNTRSSVALTRAGIPRSQWNVVDRTGQQFYEGLLNGQLQRNNLTDTGTRIIRQSGTQNVITY